MRQLNSKKSPKENFSRETWEWANRQKSIEKSEEVPLFKLTEKEFLKCRFSAPDKNTRQIECLTHTQNFTHGYKLFPPHLWDLRNGIIYRKNDKGEFEQWMPEFKNRI